MKVAIVYDRVNKFGGAERFLQTLISLFPNAPIYTLVSEVSRTSWIGEHLVYPTFLNKIKFFRTRHEILAPLAPMAFETHNLKNFDLIISVTSTDAKSILTLPNQVHICFCLTPTRYLWSGYLNYQRNYKLRFLPPIILNYFRFVDKIFAYRPDYYLAISKEVKKRISQYYQRDSVVIYPPVDSFFFVQKPQPKSKRKYYLVVSRLVPYKKVGLVVKAFNHLNKKIVIVGEGSELKQLKKIANSNVRFAGLISDTQLKKYYRHAKAVIFPQVEDFGLVPLESQASGTPVIAYGKGGALETVVNHQTGIFFKKQTISSLTQAINNFEKVNINYQNCIDNAKSFSTEVFTKKLLAYINEVVNV